MPDVRPDHLSITDPSSNYFGIPIYSENGKKALKFSARPSQPADARHPWRVAVHPWSGGLAEDRLNDNPDTYARGDVDASNEGRIVHPPKHNAVTLTNGTTPYKMVQFNSLIFILGGRYMYYYNPANNTVTEDKDFGVGKTAVDMAVFNSELVVAMGESEKLYTRNTAGTWTQAVDNTFAIALGVVGSLLWRAESTNKISNCITAPRTLTSWAPASPNQYTVGDTTWSINTIVDFNGQIWVGKADGMYAADTTWKFENQTPQLKVWPHTDNCKGSTVAQGNLFVPSSSGLLKLKNGRSINVGPEKSNRYNFRFWTRGVVEFNGVLYAIVTDEGAQAFTFICKMIRNPYEQDKYVYHEWCRLGSTTKGYAIIVTTVGTNPQLIVTHGNDIKYVLLGRGGGIDISDTNYIVGTSLQLESGLMYLTEDLSIPAVIQGVEVLLIQPSGSSGSVTVSYSVNRENPSYTNFEGETAGTSAITGQTTLAMVRRYTTAPVEAQTAWVYITGTQTANNTPQVIREVWLFGWSRPKIVDEITVVIPNDGLTLNAFGGAVGKSIDQLYQQFYDWLDASTILTAELPDYDEDVTVKVLVSGVEMTELHTIPGYEETAISQRVIALTLQRLFPIGVP